MKGKPLDTAFRTLAAGIALTLILWISQLPTDPSVAPATIPLEVNSTRPPKSPRARITGIEPVGPRRRGVAGNPPAETAHNRIPPVPVNYGSRTAPVQIVSDRIDADEPAEPVLPEITIPLPEAKTGVPTLERSAPLPPASDPNAAAPAEAGPSPIPPELQRELDQLQDLQAQFKTLLDSKDADLDRLRKQNDELIERLEEPQKSAEVPVPETPAIQSEPRDVAPVFPLPPPEVKLPIVEPAPASASPNEPKDPFSDSDAHLKGTAPEPAAETAPPASLPQLPAIRPRPAPTMPFAGSRPVPQPCSTAGCSDCRVVDRDCEHGGDDCLRKRLGANFLQKFDRDQCDECEDGDRCNSRWGLLGRSCLFGCDSGYRQPEIFGMPAGATLRPPLDPHGDFSSTPPPPPIMAPPGPTMDYGPTPPASGGPKLGY